MSEKTASVHWVGQGKTGQGKVSTESGALKDYPYGFGSRFEDDKHGTNQKRFLARRWLRVLLWRFHLPVKKQVKRSQILTHKRMCA